METAHAVGSIDAVTGVRRAAGLAEGAFALLAVLMVLAVAMLVGGEFLDAVAALVLGSGTFIDGFNSIYENAGTAFTIFSVGLLAIPAVAVVGYLWSQLGGAVRPGGFR